MITKQLSTACTPLTWQPIISFLFVFVFVYICFCISNNHQATLYSVHTPYLAAEEKCNEVRTDVEDEEQQADYKMDEQFKCQHGFGP